MKNFFEKIKNALPKDRKTQIIVSVLVVLGLVGGIALGNFSSNFVAGMTIVNLPGVPVLPESTLDPNATPGSENTLPTATLQPLLETPEPWDGKSRVNILIMGLDARDLKDTAPRTDTMILFTLDPVNLTAGMISIPRDLWVKIPGSDYNKINTAYSIGESYKLPGGGPALAVKTVEDLLGVPIQYYAQIDFEAFIKFVDHIKGVKITVDSPIRLDILGTQTTVPLEPGTYTLPGELALAYVRMRNTEGGDFDRAQRQQQVIIAIRDRILDFNMMPTLLANANAIYADLSAGIRTNLTLSQALSLAQTIMKVPRDQIKQAVIDGEYVNFGKSPTGLDILRPIPDKIRELRDEIFYGQTTSASSTAQDIQAILQDEHANVSVRNASSVAGLAEKTAEYLKGQGINVVEVTDAGYQVYSRVTLYGSKPYTLRYLVDLLKITSSSNIVYAYDPAATVDIVVELGDDWAASNTLP